MSTQIRSWTSPTWPLRVSSNGRYLEQSNGIPFLIHGDTPWSIAVQLTHNQINAYLDDRKTRGFSAILFNAIEHHFSGQSPVYRGLHSGADPFGSITLNVSADFTDPVDSYWQTVDHIVNGTKSRGMICIINPAYLGFSGGSQGWNAEVNAESGANLQAYGAFLANRYTQGNVIWCLGGDYVPGDVGHQWNIATGIRSVRPTDIITAHGARVDEEAYPHWDGQTGFNLNNIYSDGLEYDLAETAYARSGPVPFFLIEGIYDGEAATTADSRRQAYASILSGACGHLFGNNPVYDFGWQAAKSVADVLSEDLSTTATGEMGYVKDLFDTYSWELLVPTTDTSLVTTALGSGTSRVLPALASDGSFAMVWKPASGSVTIDMSALTPSSVRGRWFDTTDGTYATVSRSPWANTGTQSLTFPGERVLVLDAA